LDLVALRKAVFTNSVTDICLTKLDVLDAFTDISICTAYENGAPIYEVFEGWMSKTEGITSFDALPEKAKIYIKFIEKYVGCDISIISTGPSRDQTITR
jgi:adenylosuccinate synthase